MNEEILKNEKKINTAVFKLYRLSPKEINIVDNY
ncbi:hypothetical protein SDC9_200753 [bioreactor metagenome]|uniref:Uncharacterized protein n=1 Tax=bioreactor metagenome TaxID=1076179 RepID=A0A645IRU1_9ZZZZ